MHLRRRQQGVETRPEGGPHMTAARRCIRARSMRSEGLALTACIMLILDYAAMELRQQLATSFVVQARPQAKGWHLRPPFAGHDPGAASQQTGSDPGPTPLAMAPGIRRGFGSNIDLPGLSRCVGAVGRRPSFDAVVVAAVRSACSRSDPGEAQSRTCCI